jgi:hypothetical protein
MRDVVFEWYIPYVPSKRQRLIKAIIISAVIVFLFDAVFFASGLLLASILLAVIGFFLFRSWKYDYEYVYVNGDFTISKIIRKVKRKDVYHINRLDIGSFSHGRTLREGENSSARDFTSGRGNDSVYTITAKGERVYIETCPDFVDEMSKYYGSPSGV